MWGSSSRSRVSKTTSYVLKRLYFERLYIWVLYAQKKNMCLGLHALIFSWLCKQWPWLHYNIISIYIGRMFDMYVFHVVHSSTIRCGSLSTKSLCPSWHKVVAKRTTPWAIYMLMKRRPCVNLAKGDLDLKPLVQFILLGDPHFLELLVGAWANLCLLSHWESWCPTLKES